jgi:hypothetical protein
VAGIDKLIGGKRRAAYGGALAILAPPLISTGYLWLSFTYNLGREQSGVSDLVAFAVSIGAGLLGISMLPINRVSRAVVAVIYVPISIYLLIVWSLTFVCGQFEACV